MTQFLRKHLLIIATAWVLMCIPQEAHAYTLLYCNGSGGVGGGELFPAASGTGACQYSGIQHIFSWIICNFVQILNAVLGQMYCSMQDILAGLLAVVFTLYIAIFGVQVLMGLTQMNVKEIITRLLKIAGVWVFVTNSAWGIGYAFNFFLSFAAYGIYWVMSIVGNHVSTDFVTITSGADNIVMDVYSFFDQLIYMATIGPLNNANSNIIGVFAALGFVLPPIFFMALYWVWMNFMILARALISFLLALTAIAFLISLGPIFLSFMLFQVTYSFFESWLKYIISYTLQIVIIFACIAFWLAVTYQFINFFNDLSKVVFTSKIVESYGAVSQPLKLYGVCPYDYSPTGGTPSGPTVTCKDPSFQPDINEDPSCDTDPINCKAQLDSNIVIPPAKIPQEANFVYYVVYNLLTLIIVAYAFSALLKHAPHIAKQLAGPEYTPLIGQGWGYNRYGMIKGASPMSGIDKNSPSRSGGSMGGFLSDRLGIKSGSWRSAGKAFLEEASALVSKRK